jgi:hypothetical protein
MKLRIAMAIPLVVVGLSAPAASQGAPPAGAGRTEAAAWLDSLPIDGRAFDAIDLFAREKRSEFDNGYAARLAVGIRRLVAADVERQLGRLAEGVRAPFIEVTTLEPGFAAAGGKAGGSKTEREFEKSFVRIEVLAFFESESTEPRTALGMYTDPDFRKTVSSRLKRVWNEGDEVCIEMASVKLVLDAIKCCDCVEELHLEGISIEHARTVRNTGGKGYQPVYFKESLKTFVRLPDGLAFHYIAYTRTVGMGGIKGKIGRGKIEESERKAVEEIGRRLSARRVKR